LLQLATISLVAKNWSLKSFFLVVVVLLCGVVYYIEKCKHESCSVQTYFNYEMIYGLVHLAC